MSRSTPGSPGPPFPGPSLPAPASPRRRWRGCRKRPPPSATRSTIWRAGCLRIAASSSGSSPPTPTRPFRAQMIAALSRALIERGNVPALISVGPTAGDVANAARQLLRYRAEATVFLSGSPPASARRSHPPQRADAHPDQPGRSRDRQRPLRRRRRRAAGLRGVACGRRARLRRDQHGRSEPEPARARAGVRRLRRRARPRAGGRPRRPLRLRGRAGGRAPAAGGGASAGRGVLRQRSHGVRGARPSARRGAQRAGRRLGHRLRRRPDGGLGRPTGSPPCDRTRRASPARSSPSSTAATPSPICRRCRSASRSSSSSAEPSGAEAGRHGPE